MCFSTLFKWFLGKKEEEVVAGPTTENKNLHWGEPPANVDKPEWVPLLADPNGITVMWDEKYGDSKKENCIGLWFNKSTQQFMLTWKDSKKIILEKSNINSIVYSKTEAAI